MTIDGLSVYIVAGVALDFSHKYTRARGVVGKTVEAVARVHDHASMTLLLFTDKTYFKCDTWCE